MKVSLSFPPAAVVLVCLFSRHCEEQSEHHVEEQESPMSLDYLHQSLGDDVLLSAVKGLSMLAEGAQTAQELQDRWLQRGTMGM